MRPGSSSKNGLAREMHHFIGKDIVNFHGLFWPAMLQGADMRVPDALHVNGYLTVNGEKMSKSRGTFIMARTYLDAGLNPDYLRYYFATMLTAAPVDVDLDLKAFEERVNSHLVGKWINIASRCAGFVHKHFGGKLADSLCEDDQRFYQNILQGECRDAEYYYLSRSIGQSHDGGESRLGGEFARALLPLIDVADRINALIHDKQPWQLAKKDELSELHNLCTIALNVFRVLAIYLKPVVPTLCAAAADFLNEPDYDRFGRAAKPLLSHRINEFKPIATRIDPKNVETMIENSKESLQSSAPPSPQPSPASGRGGKSAEGVGPAVSVPSTVSIDDFAKLDLRVAKVLACEFVDGSDKLLRFELDAGELGKRQIFSGIRAAYQAPEKLVGRKVVFIANLAPRKMRFGMSEGMILSAGSGGSELFLLDADDGAQPGMPVK
jgi:methionyl-tRNA synthetase